MPVIDWKDKPLFTPGPLTTSPTVKQAMLRDLGSRDSEFIGVIRDIRRRLVALANVDEKDFTAIPMQGSGTFGLEAVLASTVPPGGKVLVAINGAYGRRLVQMAGILGIETVALEFDEDEPVQPKRVADALKRDDTITHVSVCHCETTTGILNPIKAIGEAVATAGRTYFVDAMSAFGAVPTDMAACHIDYLVSSANKCIEGVPGFSFVIARLARLTETRGYARSLALDLLSQHEGLEKNGQFRFTPPTHAVLAFRQALLELEQEGGVEGRAARYRENYETLVAGMRSLGFEEYLRPEVQSYIITSFRYPPHANFDFDTFYEGLNQRGYVIYPGKVSGADCFRIGMIGRLFKADVEDLLAAIRRTLP